MSVITCVPEKNLWNEICKEFESRRPPFTAGLVSPDEKIFVDYDASKHTPVFYGDMHAKIDIDPPVQSDFDSSLGHPACVGYAFLEPPQEETSTPQCPPPRPDKKTCSPKEFLDYYIFPILLPALEEMLHEAVRQKCFERKRTRFNALDFLTEFLYKYNPDHCGRECITFPEIPFVKLWWEKYPRPPLPLSVLLSEPESILIIQSFWRGYKVRLDESVGELRQWQKDWREGNCNISTTVNDFWANKMPEDKGTNVSNNNSGEPGEETENLNNNAYTDAEDRPDDINLSNNGSSEINQRNYELLNSANSQSKNQNVLPGGDNEEVENKPSSGNFDRPTKGTFSFNAFKRVYSNCDIKNIALPFFWEKFDSENYSIWCAEYKYPEELRHVFESCNLVSGLYQRLDGMRDRAFGSSIVFGTNNDSTISSVWVLTGQEVPFQLCEDLEHYNWTKLDPESEQTKKLVEEYFTLEGDFGGKIFNEGMIFK